MKNICPNYNSPEWKALESNVGRFEAMRDFLEHDGEIRTPDQVISKLNSRVNSTNNNSKESLKEVSSNNSSLFGLDINNEQQLEFHVNTLNVISNFLENIGVEQRLVPEFLDDKGSIIEGAVAAANFMKGTVDIIDDLNKGRLEAWNKLPEEAAHWWYRLLDNNSELKDALLTSSKTDRKEAELRNSLYDDVYPKVIGKLALDANGNITSKPALSPIREEAIGQLIAETIKRIETKNANASDYSFFKKFLDWINTIIDIFKNTIQDPFEVAAMKILSSDMSDLMTWEEYRKVNNIVNFSDVLTEQSVTPVDYTIISDLGKVVTNYFEPQGLDEKDTFKWVANLKEGVQKNSPEFNTQQELDNWVSANIKEHDKRQKAKIQEVRDNQNFFDRLLNKSFRKKSRFLPKTLRKYYEIIDSQNLNPLSEWNIFNELQLVTKKLSDIEKEQIIKTNGYTNIAPTLKILPDILKKYGNKHVTEEVVKAKIELTKKRINKEITKEQANEEILKINRKAGGIPIVLSEAIKIDGAKKQELSILNGIREMIKLENPNLKSITAEEFVAEVHNWLETNYLLGFANETSYLSYRTDQTFNHLNDRKTNEDIDITNLTDEQIQRLPFQERQRIADIVGLTKQNPDVYHNKVSIRFNDRYHLKSGHFPISPSAWGNLTYFYTGKNKWKDAVLLHEIQNDNIEFLKEYKSERVDLETSFGRYLQQLNTDLIDNINQIQSGGKSIRKFDILTANPPKQHFQLNFFLNTLIGMSKEQGFEVLKQRLDELINLFKSDQDSLLKNPKKAYESIEKYYEQKLKFQDLQRRGGIKSLLSEEDLNNLKQLLYYLNHPLQDPVGEYVYGSNVFDTPDNFSSIKSKKKLFKARSNDIVEKINSKAKELYGDDFPNIVLEAPAKPLPKAQRRPVVRHEGTIHETVSGNSSNELNENVNFLIAFSEKNINKEISKKIEVYKQYYVNARNAVNAYNFNVSLSKITQEQYNTLIDNYLYNLNLLQELIDEQAQKDINSPELQKLAKAKSIISYLGDDPSVKLGKGKYGFMWDTADTEKGIIAVWDAYKIANTSEDSYIDNWTVDEFLNYVKEVAPEYLNLDTKSIDKQKQQSQFESLKQKALDKKAELEKNYGKIEEEVKQTLEIEMNYFTPLVHHLIQKHINQYGKDFPMYFSGYQITKLTQGNYRTALLYAGKDEVPFTKEESDIIKYKVAEILGLVDTNLYLIISDSSFSTEGYNNLSKDQLEFGLKKLSEFKRKSKENLDTVINKIMVFTNKLPIETGAMYNAMSQISGIKLIWQNKIDGLKDNAGGYLVDLSNYNYNVPILYGLNSKLNSKVFSPEVNASMKSLQILASDEAKSIFTKGKKNGWSLDKILTELRIPKEQKQLISDLGKSDLDEIFTDLLANYSYTIEINTAKEKNLGTLTLDNPDHFIDNFGNEYSREYSDTHEGFDYFKNDKLITKQELEKARKESFEEDVKDQNTQHYSNLTVPGGTNYTENEIATPAIIPAIKGHAQFSTDNGIGWFRSDDRLNQVEVMPNTGDTIEDVFGKPTIHQYIGGKTRRILEVQSDLFQKSRDIKSPDEIIEQLKKEGKLQIKCD